MSGTSNSETGTNSPGSAAGSSDGGHRHLSRGRRLRPTAPPDLGALAREAVVNFLNDASKATAEREAPGASLVATDARPTAAAAGYAAVGGAGQADAIPAAAPEPETMPWDAVSAVSRGADSEAWRAAAISVAALDRIEAAAAKVEADIAAALRTQAELRAGAGAAAEAAVDAALSARAAAGAAVEAERKVRISLRQVRQYMVITFVLVLIMIVVLVLATSPVH